MLNSMIARILPVALRLPSKACVSILNYHRVVPAFDDMRPHELTVNDFEWQMRLISNYFTPISLADALSGLESDTLPENAVCVTFDDGYADNQLLALPIMQRYNVPLTLFVATGFLNGGRMWNDTVIESLRVYDSEELDLSGYGLEVYPTRTIAERVAAVEKIIGVIKYWPLVQRRNLVELLESLASELPKDLMLSDSQLVSLRDSGVEIGAHTVNHPILANLTKEQVESEISAGKSYLESLLGQRIRYFAYPNGKLNTDYRPEQCTILDGMEFEAALTTNWGVTSKTSDLYQLPRFTPWDRTPSRFLFRMFMNYRAV